MPTTILDLEATDLPTSVTLPATADSAFMLFRWHGVPVGHTTERAIGTLSGDHLRDLLVSCAGLTIMQRELEESLGLARPSESGPERRVSVAVCTRDRVDDLARCLNATDRLSSRCTEVLVVDSASHDPAPVAREVARHPRARLVRSERPGLDVARNIALREARQNIVAFTDDDATPDAGWLDAIVRGFADERTLCVTGLTLPSELETPAQDWFERTNSFARGYARRRYDGLIDDRFNVARIGAGVNMAFRRSVLDLVGSFDEALDAGTPTKSGGDFDMFSRILGAGYAIVYEPSALNWHRHRREWRALRSAVRGYGTGVWAFLSRHFLDGDWNAGFIALGWARYQLRNVYAGIVRRPGHVPLDLSLAEIQGCLAGPFAYLRARRAARARAA